MNDEADKIKERLKLLMKPEAVDSWLERPNPAFNNEKPIDLMNQGRTDELWRMIYLIESGGPS